MCGAFNLNFVTFPEIYSVRMSYDIAKNVAVVIEAALVVSEIRKYFLSLTLY